MHENNMRYFLRTHVNSHFSFWILLAAISGFFYVWMLRYALLFTFCESCHDCHFSEFSLRVTPTL